MNNITVLLTRLVVSVIIAIIIGAFFFDGNRILKTIGLAVVMLILAYLFEYTKKQS